MRGSDSGAAPISARPLEQIACQVADSLDRSPGSGVTRHQMNFLGTRLLVKAQALRFSGPLIKPDRFSKSLRRFIARPQSSCGTCLPAVGYDKMQADAHV